mgnify:CR=1 FL=1
MNNFSNIKGNHKKMLIFSEDTGTFHKYLRRMAQYAPPPADTIRVSKRIHLNAAPAKAFVIRGSIVSS